MILVNSLCAWLLLSGGPSVAVDRRGAGGSLTVEAGRRNSGEGKGENQVEGEKDNQRARSLSSGNGGHCQGSVLGTPKGTQGSGDSEWGGQSTSSTQGTQATLVATLLALLERRYVALFATQVVVIYPVLLIVAGELTKCVRIHELESMDPEGDGRSVLWLAPRGACYDPSWTIMVFFCLPMLGLVPVFLLAFLVLAPRLSQRAGGRAARLTESVSDVFTRAFKEEFFWWDAFLMLRRLVIALVVVFVDPEHVQLRVAFCVSALFLLVHLIVQPFRTALDHWCETVCLFNLTVLAGLRRSTLETLSEENYGRDLFDDYERKLVDPINCIMLVTPYGFVIVYFVKKIFTVAARVRSQVRQKLQNSKGAGAGSSASPKGLSQAGSGFPLSPSDAASPRSPFFPKEPLTPEKAGAGGGLEDDKQDGDIAVRPAFTWQHLLMPEPTEHPQAWRRESNQLSSESRGARGGGHKEQEKKSSRRSSILSPCGRGGTNSIDRKDSSPLSREKSLAAEERESDMGRKTTCLEEIATPGNDAQPPTAVPNSRPEGARLPLLQQKFKDADAGALNIAEPGKTQVKAGELTSVNGVQMPDGAFRDRSKPPLDQKPP
uniref:Transmembrane protein n=1 Tax=Chromera velia CCMP2878 TaxID=1169474 RepID=A0A0G4FWS5_9ALVE|eukprot:Cvel_19153.t1-p1 / transcript=Cvel_19153.t1 / gene=Cvel_19153 / organism=Chromera_velia_CCMP2878 / gene_product=hypothetical protein / transcript_product=hypothetical protein / location=Cvel_scaffold1630:7819-13374(-) / protein_length=603 / sequence_SO=supercontig / SO=protein_coding / is_pseudo=false